MIILGILLNDLGLTEEALIDYSKIIEIDPQYADIYLFRGRYNILISIR